MDEKIVKNREGLHLGLRLGLHYKNEMCLMGLHLGLQNLSKNALIIVGN